jgi:transposase
MANADELSREELLEVIETLEEKTQQLQQNNQRFEQQTQQLEAKVQQLTTACEAWKLAYEKLWRERFEARSERYIADPQQLVQDFGGTEEAIDAAEGLSTAIEEAELAPAPSKPRKPRKQRDESLPAHLPRYEVIAEVPDSQKTCPTHGARQLLPEAMWDRTETLEFTPPALQVRVTKHPKFACLGQPECGIGSAERRLGIVEGDRYAPSIGAQIITGKSGYHLPLYRQQDYFAGSGWSPGRSTLLNIVAGCYFVVQPLLAYFKQVVQTDSVIGCDDTSVTLLYPKNLPQFELADPKQKRISEVFAEALKQGKPSIRAKMWAYRGASVKLNVFDFTVSRHRDGPESFFADYSGVLLGDCWNGFGSIAIASQGAIARAACNSHARRKIRDSVAYPKERAHWLGWFQQLYDIEDRGRVMSAEERLALRQSEAKPIWKAMQTWLAEAAFDGSSQTSSPVVHVVIPSSDFAKALKYLRNHFIELSRYVDDAQIPIDNNETEQLMKQVALGRKNWLFAGSIEGGERNAGFFTLVSSALRNDLDVWRYVTDVLEQLLSGVTDYAPLLPWNWAQAHPEAIRQYRVQERRERAERKSENRAERRRLKLEG